MDGIRRKLLATTLAVALALAGGSTYAADLVAPKPDAPMAAAPDGFYVSVFAGGAIAADPAWKFTGPDNSGTVSLPLNPGFLGGAALGMRVTPHLRGEIEVSYVGRTVTGTISYEYGIPGLDPSAASGTMRSLFLLGNLWYDFDAIQGIKPYIGGGVGAAMLIPDVFELNVHHNTGATVFAAQLGAGAKIPLATNLDLDLGYRLKTAFNGTLTPTEPRGSIFSNVTRYDHVLQAGLTLKF